MGIDGLLYRERLYLAFPKVKSDAVCVDDGNIITSAGVAASLDGCLYAGNRSYGSVIANHVAR